jgi:hypothetical protein
MFLGIQRDAHVFMRFSFYFWSFTEIADIYFFWFIKFFSLDLSGSILKRETMNMRTHQLPDVLNVKQKTLVFDKGTFIKIFGKRKNALTIAVTHQYVVRALDGFYTETANGSISFRFMIFLAYHRL